MYTHVHVLATYEVQDTTCTCRHANAQAPRQWVGSLCEQPCGKNKAAKTRQLSEKPHNTVQRLIIEPKVCIVRQVSHIPHTCHRDIQVWNEFQEIHNPLIHPSTSQIQHSWDHGKISVSNISFFTSRCIPVTNRRIFFGSMRLLQYPPLCSIAQWCDSPPEGQRSYASYALGDPARSRKWCWTETAPLFFHDVLKAKTHPSMFHHKTHCKKPSHGFKGVWVILLLLSCAVGATFNFWSKVTKCTKVLIPVPSL